MQSGKKKGWLPNCSLKPHEHGISGSSSSSPSWTTMIHLHHCTLPRTPTSFLAAAFSSSTKTSLTPTANNLLFFTRHSSWSLFSYGGAVSVSHRKNTGISCASAASGDEISSSQEPIAILLEVEGVLMDVYRWVNREAFNLAFQKLGLDCANWTEPIYMDLVRKAFGNEERMLMLFFNRIGWPTSLPTNEKETFMRSVLREKRNALDEFVMTKSLPLRPGVEDFVDDALVGGIPVVILTAYCKNEDAITRSIIEKLGPDRISRIKIVGKEEVEGSFYGQLVLRKGGSSSLDEQLAKEVSKAAAAEKHKVAEEVASMLNVTVELGSGTTESVDKFVATIRAGAEYAGVPVQRCVLIAGNRPGLLGAERVGMPCVVLRSSLTARTEFPSANAVMDDFGGADLTLSKLRHKIWP